MSWIVQIKNPPVLFAYLVIPQRYITKHTKKQGVLTLKFHIWMRKFAVQGSLLSPIGCKTKCYTSLNAQLISDSDKRNPISVN